MCWKFAKVVPIHKNSRKYSVNDYRPISMLPSLSKAMEIIIKTQVISHIDDHNYLYKFQSGFRSNHSTTTAMLKITDDVRRAFENKCISALLLLDFSKAFDCVSHSLILSKLVTKFNFSSSATGLLKSYLDERYQCVSILNVSSSFLPVLVGVH